MNRFVFNTFNFLLVCAGMLCVAKLEVLAEDVSSAATEKEYSRRFEKNEAKSKLLVGSLKSGKSEDRQQPIYIKSDEAQLQAQQREFKYNGNVEVIQCDLLITSNTLVGDYSANNRLKTITCEQNVVITRGEELRATANRAVYNVERSTIELTQGPEVLERGNVLTADKITVFLEEDRSEAEGEVRVKVLTAEEPNSASVTGPISSSSTG